MKKIILSVAMALGVYAGMAQTISTFAGSGVVGYGGDGGPATAAQMNYPVYVAFDHSGNLFVSELFNNRVRRIDHVTGIITTYAGTGVSATNGDGGPATAAALHQPAGIAFDAADNLYISELYGHVVRKVNAAGIISTFVGTGVSGYSGDGGPATAAKMQGPNGLAIDGAGNMYIADYFNARVRKVDPSGTITTVVGIGVNGFSGDGGPATAAKVRQLVGIECGPDGSLYVVDQLNHVVRKVDPAGIISTYAGTPGVSGYTGDGGMATNAKLDIPAMVKLDAAGNLYIGVQYSNVTRVVSPAGIITTFAGTGVADHTGDGGPATAATMHEPSGMAFDADGNIYIADHGNNCVRKVTMPMSTDWPSTVCVGSTVGLTGAPAGGTWTSSNTAVATVDASGLVTGLSAGTTSISYTTTGGTTTGVLTVVAAPTVTGTPALCTGLTTTLSSPDAGGVWTSGNTAVATVDAATGVVRGVAAGAVAITYTNAAGCSTAVTVGVKAGPAAIGGTKSVCLGGTSVLSDATGGGVSWTSSNTAVATISSTSGIVSGISAGTAVMTYTITNGCYATAVVTVNALPAVIGGTPNVCAGSATTLTDAVSGGSWSSSNAVIATVGSGTGVVTGVAPGTATISYSVGPACTRTVLFTVKATPAAIAGTGVACTSTTTTLSNTGGGSWASGNTAVATVLSGSGVVTGVSAGTALIVYTTANGCSAGKVVTINSIPSASTGTGTVCVGSATTLSNALPGGTWVSANTAYAVVDAGTGVVTGVGAGTTTISYTFGGACLTKKIVTVNALPGVITGTRTVCAGSATTLTNSSGPGTWSSANTAVGTIGSISAVAGRFAGLMAGTSVVSYTFPNGCARTVEVTVNPTPDAGTIMSAGGFVINTSSAPTSVALSSTGDAGGAWSSGNTGVATVNSGGLVSAVSGGNTNIVYTVTLGGCVARAMHTVNVVVARMNNNGGGTGAMDNATIKLFPNPNKGVFTVAGEGLSMEDNQVTIEVVDMLGQVVYSNSVTGADGAINEHIALSSTLPNGMYLLNIQAGGDRRVFSFVLQ